MKKLVFISAVSGVGKSTTCEYIKNNNLLEDYAIFDIDDLENINDYNESTYNCFYENAVKKAVTFSKDKNIVIGSCINPNDIEKINMPNEIESYINILITCSNEELRNRLKARDESRQCSSDEYIKGQIDYQQYLLKNIELYQMHVDNTEDVAENVSRKIANFIKYGEKMIIEYESKYDEEIKDLLVQLQQYLADMDKEGYNIVGDEYREKYFEKTIEDVKRYNGKILLYKDNEKIAGLIVGIVNNDETVRYDFRAPKRGRITELVVDKEYRGKGIGKTLLNEMKDYLKSIGCEKVLIAVFGYNESAIKFYKENGFHIRMMDMIED